MASENDINEYEKVLRRARSKYIERDEVHRSLWKKDEPRELAGQALHKAKRVEHQTLLIEGAEQAIDDALDGINYFVFTILRLQHKVIPDFDG